ncbi:hypothetical protein E1301_Tti011938 [Triplophysa tibetana]|uniref:G protein gamma domain-containing protein n=1 Tax=Triplophysa tibetana TaxID=1572043 RepID=A0A5A9PL85_9TELE|nr:hypothetical protein E1301_Tti011938 [Triplophysa tibetana]
MSMMFATQINNIFNRLITCTQILKKTIEFNVLSLHSSFWMLFQMDELDETQLNSHVESLKQQLQYNREKTSVSIPELVKWIEEKMTEDAFLILTC